MDNLLNMVLEAHNPERNHHRRYELMVGRDMFGAWMLTIRYGRVGSVGHIRHFSSTNPRDIQRIMRQSLHRRSGASRRIGCSYRLMSCSSSPKLDRTAWLPNM